MRCILISSRSHPTQGGPGAYVHHMAEAAHAAGWETHLITRACPHPPPDNVILRALSTPDDDPAFEPRIAPLRTLDRIRPYRYALWSLAVADHLLSLDFTPDLIEFADTQAEGYASICSPLLRARFPQTPLIVHAHAPMFLIESLNHCDLSRFHRHLYHRWERAALAHADAVIAPSQLLADALTNMPTSRDRKGAVNVQSSPSPHPRAPIHVLPPPLDLHLPNTAPREQLLLLLGNIEPNKAPDLWAQSLNIVFDQHPSARAILLGPDTPTAPEHFTTSSSFAVYVRSLIDAAHQSRFTIQHHTPRCELLRLIARAACVVVPSRFESFSFAAAEAVSSLTPIVLSTSTGIREFIPSAATVPTDDPLALAHAQLNILNNPARAAADARICFDELQRATIPAHITDARAHLLQALRSSPSRQDLPSNLDALAELQSFIHETDLLELSTHRPSQYRTERPAPSRR